MKLIRALPNGKSIRRDDTNRLWLYDERDILVGEIQKGTLAAQILSLTPQDFNEVPTPESTSTVSVPGPVSPPVRREPYPWYKRIRDRLRGL